MTTMTEVRSDDIGSKSRQRHAHAQNIVPLCFTYSVVIVSWIGFVFFIVIKDALIQRHDAFRAASQTSISGLLFALTILSLLTASTRPPGKPDPDMTPDGVSDARERKEWDEDDIPLEQLRKKRRPDLSLATISYAHEDKLGGAAAPNSGSSGSSPEVSPFPLNISPFVPVTATDAGEDESDKDTATNEALRDHSQEYDNEEGDNEDRDRLLPATDRGRSSEHRQSLIAKNSSGGHRWCSKCDAWKPDRCHHCRYCKQCTLKMDHHCIWIGSCVGYHNYKPFLLFVSYGTLLAFFIFINSGLSMIHYFIHPEDYTSASSSGMEVSELTPVSFMLLTFIGAFFTMTMGGLAGYHWYLVCRNKTTLEDVTHTYPSALVEERRIDGASQIGWRGDHLLTRPERVRLRQEASALNVYDLGWRRNIREVFMRSGRSRFADYLACLWPLTASRDRLDRTAGHYFDYDPVKLARLQDLTRELRLGYRAEEQEYI